MLVLPHMPCSIHLFPVAKKGQGSAARSLVSVNRWLIDIKTYMFQWLALTMLRATRARTLSI